MVEHLVLQLLVEQQIQSLVVFSCQLRQSLAKYLNLMQDNKESL